MARVVQRRGAPPYMLILLVFLFLVSTTLAVLFYVRSNDNAKALKLKQDDYAKLRKDKGDGDEVIGKLISMMTGQTLTYNVVVTEVERTLGLEHAKDYPNLFGAIAGLNEKVGNLNKDIEEQTSTSNGLKDTIVKKDEEIAQIRKTLTDKLDEAQQRLAGVQKKSDEALETKDAQLKRRDEINKAFIEKKDQRITALAAELDTKVMQVLQREDRINELLKIIGEKRGKEGEVGELALRKPDGKVARVFLNQKICYIDLGEKDRITTELPFSVYSAQTGIPADGRGKAKIMVTKVDSITSECRIVESSPDDPIMEDDLILNVVFSSTRTYNFVVEGEFDLYGTGRIDPLASRRVRALIESFGGKVTDVISVDTDFVVMGNEPMRPSKPGEDAPDAVWQVYKEKLKTYDHYKQVKATAISLQIPILNTNRFLAFSGYAPKKRLAE